MKKILFLMFIGLILPCIAFLGGTKLHDAGGVGKMGAYDLNSFNLLLRGIRTHTLSDMVDRGRIQLASLEEEGVTCKIINTIPDGYEVIILKGSLKGKRLFVPEIFINGR